MTQGSTHLPAALRGCARTSNRSRKHLAAWGFAALVMASPLAANAAVINFDDLVCSTSTVIANGYSGLNWTNFYCIDSSTSPQSGYAVANVSGSNAAFNANANPAEFSITAPGSTKFNLASVSLTAAWNDNLVVTIEAYRDSALISTTTHSLSATAPTLVTLGLTQMDRVHFSSAGGTPHPGYNGGGAHFAMDNLDITFGPPPSAEVTPVPTLSQWGLLMLSGLMGAAALRRRNRS